LIRRGGGIVDMDTACGGRKKSCSRTEKRREGGGSPAGTGIAQAVRRVGGCRQRGPDMEEVGGGAGCGAQMVRKCCRGRV